MVRFIAEFGSCHMGKLSNIERAIDMLVGTGIELKLQLFPNEAPYVPTNVWLDPEMFKAAYYYAKGKGVVLSASVFDANSFLLLKELKPKFIKFAYSQKEKAERMCDSEIIASSDIMTGPLNGVTNLYCIPEYPVRYVVDFNEIFPKFDGFSDHTMGLEQTKRAIDAGAKIIEKHVRLGSSEETCPDARFAVNLDRFIQFVRLINNV